MLNLLAQSYDYTYTTTTTTNSKGLAAALAAWSIVWLVLAILAIVGGWKVFEKAGEKGWKVLIPFYNAWIIAEIAGRPGYWGLVSLLGLLAFIPVIGWLLSILILVVWVIIALDLAKAFGKSTAFGVLLILFPYICMLILGFGDAKYVGKRFKTNTSTPAPKA